MSQGKKSAEARYNELKTERSHFLDRAQKCAKLTLPAYSPEENAAVSDRKMITPYQAVGGRGVNNLASKLLLTLLPPNAPFFRYVIDRSVLEQEGQEELRTSIEQGLSKMEKLVLEDIETSGDRTSIFEALKHLIINGNAALAVEGDSRSQLYPLSRYVCVRDPVGNVVEGLLLDQVAPAAMDPEFLEKLDQKVKDQAKKASTQKHLNVYTWITLKNDQWHIHQECGGEIVPGTSYTVPKDKSPFLFLRFVAVEGEDYGRSYVEEYLGDLMSLEGLTKALVEGSAAAARILILVHPNGTTNAKVLEQAPNGAIREGTMEDVSVLQLEKYADFRVAYSMIERLEQRLEYAFLLHTAIQRQAERVTAEEIRVMAGELEDALGGIYSVLSQEFQLPYAKRRMAILERAGKLPDLPEDLVKPTIVTGLDALGRGHDRSKLEQFIGTLSQALGPQALQFINPQEAVKRLALSIGIDPEGLLKTQEQIQQEQQQAMMAQMADRVAPDVVKAGANMLQNQGTPNAPAQE